MRWIKFLTSKADGQLSALSNSLDSTTQTIENSKVRPYIPFLESLSSHSTSTLLFRVLHGRYALVMGPI